MRAGDTVEDFTATDQNGRSVSFSELRSSGPVVVFFYPKAMTGGCTTESCHFRDLAGDLAELDATAVGVSADTVEAQAQFYREHDLGMPLLSDPDRAVAKQFGVKRPGPLWNRRATFVIAKDGTLLEEISSERNMEIHADRALEVLRAAS